MKKLTLFGFLAIISCVNVIGQSGTFRAEFTFNQVNGSPTKYQAGIDINVKSPDLANSANVQLFTGDPSAVDVQNFIFHNLSGAKSSDHGKYDIGNFYVTDVSPNPLSFIMNYGYSDVDGDERIVFDKVTYTTGKYKETETPEQTLTRKDISWDCNIVEQNCRVYQTHSFSIKRDKVLSSTNCYDNVSFITIRYYMSGKIAYTLIFPYTVQGANVQYLSTGPGPYELLNIIRAVPGDQSSAFMTKNSSTVSEVTMGAQKSDSKTESLSATVSAGFALGPIGGSVEATASSSVTNTKVQGSENTYIQEFVAEETYTNDNSVGDKSDLFIVAQRKYDYGMEYAIKAQNRSNVTYINSDMKMLFQPKVDSMKIYPYTEKQLINEIIPYHDGNNEKGKANYWKMLVHKNDSIKKAVKLTPFDKSFAASISGPFTYQTEYAKSSSLTLSQEISIEETESISVKAEVGGFGSSASIEGGTSWTVTTTSSSSNTNGQGDKVTTGYSIFDQNYLKKDYRGGDKLHLKVWRDPATGTAVWELDEALSATSCPYEGGHQLDQPEITVEDPNNQTQVKSAKYSDIPLLEQRTFVITIRNNNSKEARAYDIRIPNTTTKPTVTSPDDLGVPFILAAGESTTIELTVTNKGTKAKAYKNFKVIFGPECDPSVCDTVLLSAFFGGTDDESAPENDFAVDAFEIPTDGSLVTTYISNWGVTKNLTTSFATISQGEAALVPPTNCGSGWCPETNAKPEITNSVWFKFVVANPETKISTCSPFDPNWDVPLNSQMSVFKATDVNDFSTFTRIASNDDDASCENVKASFIALSNLTVGDTLYIMVDGFKGQQADFGIFIYSPRPQNDDHCGLRVYADASVGHYTNYRSGVEANEQALIPVSTDPVTGWKADAIQHSVHFWFTIPDNGDVNIDLTNATFDAQMSVYKRSGGCVSDFSQWELVAANDDPSSTGGGLNCRIELRGQEKYSMYQILVDGYNRAEGAFDLTLTMPVEDNDEPCNAVMLNMDEQEQGIFFNGGATATAEEQVLAPPYGISGSTDTWSDKDNSQFSRKIEHSAWFKFVAPSGGAVELSACDLSTFILQMAVYEVGDCKDYNTYKLIKAEDNSQFCKEPPSTDYPNGRDIRGSIITVENLKPDSTYYVLVDGSINEFGFFSFNLTALPSDPPANDDPCNAINIPANGLIQKGYSNLGSTKTTNSEYVLIPDNWQDKSIDHTVWFKFEAPSSGEAEISTCDMANFDSQIAVYQVTNCADFNTYTLIGANEDGPKNCATNGDSFLPLKGLTSGTTYYVVVDAYGFNPGNFDIVIRDKVTSGPANDDVTKAILLPVNGVIQKGYNNLFATVMSLEQDIRPKYNSQQENCITGWCDNQVDNSVWFKFIAPTSGNVSISTCDLADFDTQLALFETTDENDFTKYKLVAANDAGPAECETYFDSYLPVTGLTSQKTYYIMVDGFDADNGNFDIVLSEDINLSNAIVADRKTELNVYPNPFNNIVNLEFSNPTKISSIQVYDVTGIKLFETSTLSALNTSTSQVDLSGVSSGILFLVITTDEGIEYKKMVKN